MLLSSRNTAIRDMQSARRISRPYWLLFAVLSATLLSSGCARRQQSEQASSGNPAKTEVAPPFSAEMWLQWDVTSRTAFVLGNLRGYWDGVNAGCGKAKLVVGTLRGVSGFTPEVADEMSMRCVTWYKPSNRSIESYVEVVTNFYNRYPEDRTIEIQEVLLLAIDPVLTAEDIHKRIKITQTPNF
jgi:hypothetical protein